MPRNGSGTFSLSAGNPVVTGTTISSTTHNNTMSDIATALTNSLAKDGQTTPTANLPMGNFRITGLGDATTATDAAKVSQVQNSSYILLSSMSGTDTITATLTPTPSAYASGQIFIGVAAGTNTGATTLNLSSLGAKDVFYGGKALTGGEISEDQLVGFRYDGTQFELIPLNFVSTDSGASAHPSLPIYRNSGTPAANDELGEVLFDGNDDGGNRTTYASDQGEIETATDGSEDGRRSFWSMIAGTLTKVLVIGKGLYTPNATGGDQGADTANVLDYYRDGNKVIPPIIIRKTVNESVTTSTTLQDDDDFTFSIAANEVVIIHMTLFMNSPTGADFKAAWSIPTGAAGEWSMSGLSLAATVRQGDGRWIEESDPTTVISIGGGGDNLPLEVRAVIVNGANSGAVTFQWAQDTSSGTTTLRQQSHMLLYRL